MRIGAHYLGDGLCEFTVWAPLQTEVSVQITSPEPRTIPLRAYEAGYWRTIESGIAPNSRYGYLINGQVFPDPASRYQPDGVHEPSAVVDLDFKWSDRDWQGIPLESMIFYELHVGTFTPEGTFAAIIPRLPELKELGINAIELMPLSQVSGDGTEGKNVAYRNWGYDGVYPYSVQNSFGTPQELQQLVNACHQHGIAVVLDVVYNHLGPEGCYHGQFGPYFTEAYRTAWGNAINMDDAHSLGVRRHFIESALYWLREFHIDALRLDAVQAIYDFGAKHFLWELADEVAALSQELQRSLYLIAESDLNDPRLIRPVEQGGYNLNAQWSDDFHHSLHSLLTGERSGYYSDFGTCADLAKAYEHTFVYDWKFSEFRQRCHGVPCDDRPMHQFVVCIQNHDQVGNQPFGQRLGQLISFERVKLGAAAMLLSPYLPLIFMGEEYGETAPFTYFISHGDPDLVQAVREGRKREFREFHVQSDPPDAAAIDTFLQCKLDWSLRDQGNHQILLNWYRQLIQLRQTHPVLRTRDRECIQAIADDDNKTVVVRRWSKSRQQTGELVFAMNFNSEPVTLALPIRGKAAKYLDSAHETWAGPGTQTPSILSPKQTLTLAPSSVVLYEQE
ncbi:malto-oligosyltrehalose trehalohydrolase [Leptolyngbya sp. AN02str]|uniref:malto-oligosyltrehalose trehalohydrolase n=1 Tax=Leptolyngbya sp. AN02str TaxID=3423363 RepID=UPI003D31B302